MRISLFLMAAMAAFGLSTAAQAAITSTYGGNAATGFGGPFGTGSLTVSDDGAGNITFTLYPNGSDYGGNDAVLYLDTKPGGNVDTSLLNDQSDFGHTLIDGATPSNGSDGNQPTRTTAVFPAGFGADVGIDFETGVYSAVFDITNPTSFTYLNGNSIGANGPYSVTVTRTQLGIGPTDPIGIVGSLISGSLYRSNETIGSSIVPVPADGGGNAGFNGSIVYASDVVFSVPEPASLSLLALAGLATLRRRLA